MFQTWLGIILFGAALSPVVLGLGWAIWEGQVRPSLITKREIERLADEVLAEDHEDPIEVVEGYEYHAWRHSDGFEQGKWKRVRRAIQRRLGQ